MSRVQPTFRLALATLIVGLITIAVFSVGASARHFGSNNAKTLSAQVLDQTLQRIDLRIQAFLRVAVRQNRLSQRLIETGQLTAADVPAGSPPTAEDFAPITGHFYEAMQVHGGLTNLGIGLEATGEFCMIARKPEGLTSVNYVRAADDTMDVRLYTFTPEGRQPSGSKAYDGYDPRRRPFYRGVVEADASAWTDAYLFFGAGGGGRVPGVTYGTPIRAEDGSIAAVTHADFALQALCEFLEDLREEVEGFAFVVELREDGSRRAIAHPDPGALLHRTTDAEGKDVTALAETLDQLGDARARSFLASLPPLSTDAPTEANASAMLEVEHQGEAWFGAYRRLGGGDAPNWVTCMMIPRGTIMASVERNDKIALGIGLVSFLLAALLSVLIASRVSEPLARIAAQCAEIGRFNLMGPSLGRSSIVELDRLMTATDEMKVSLRSFQRYVPERLVRQMADAGRVAELGGESRTLTVYFSHVVGFADMQARLTTEELVEQLGKHFAAVTDEVEASGGTLDKYIGDAVMAFWGAPQALDDHALRACRAALAASKRTVQRACAGINTGELVVGNMGSQSRLNYTVLGDAVNIAARLEGLNKFYGTQILLGEATHAAVREHVVARKVDVVAVKGKKHGVAIYELLAMRDDADPELVERAAAYEAALGAYLARRWDEAAAGLEAILTTQADDRPSHVLLARVRAYAETEPDDTWDGVYVMTTK